MINIGYIIIYTGEKMKKYQNIGETLATVEFESHTQFLSRGQFIESDEVVVRISKNIVVTDLVEQEVVVEQEAGTIDEVPVTKKKVRKKQRKKA
jgi:hypothetical protein